MGLLSMRMALGAIQEEPIEERIVDLGFELAMRDSTAGPDK
jgi:DNA-binding LacI/PurR family transcriptional regulator